ncbi:MULTISPECIES: hypothetical protein [unclassified Providencia]|uniref:hypothetical protein n=1 Tax=unclassified Providencia TaxID=2633465 RepID=UPI00234930A3|nr:MULTISPECIES: hypothetical protein [unclassified Providencia]
MWIIHQISSLNPETSSFKPVLHLTNNRGEGHSITLDVTHEDVRKLTISQLEDVANHKVNIKDLIS